MFHDSSGAGSTVNKNKSVASIGMQHTETGQNVGTSAFSKTDDELDFKVIEYFDKIFGDLLHRREAVSETKRKKEVVEAPFQLQ